MAATGAHFGRIAWIDEEDGDAVSGAFVLDEVDQLPEGPRGDHAFEPFAAFESVADTVESFEADHGIIVLEGDVHDGGADLVVEVAHVPLVFTSLCPDAVEAVMSLVTTTEFCRVLSSVACFLATEEGDIVWGCDGCQSHDAQVNAYERRFAGTSGRHWGYADGQHCIPVVTTPDQFGIALCVKDVLSVLFGDAQREPDEVFVLPNGDTQDNPMGGLEYSVGVSPKADPLGFAHPWERGSSVVSGLSRAVVGACQGDGSVDGHSGIATSETVLFLYRVVDEFVQFGAARRPVFVRSVEAKLDCLAEGTCCGFEPLPFSPCWLQNLDYDGFCVVHKPIITRPCKYVKAVQQECFCG